MEEKTVKQESTKKRRGSETIKIKTREGVWGGKGHGERRRRRGAHLVKDREGTEQKKLAKKKKKKKKKEEREGDITKEGKTSFF